MQDGNTGRIGGPDTYWRTAEAGRVSLLLDNAVYFKAVAAALRMARHSVVLVGWEFDPRAPTDPDRHQSFADLLNGLVAERPQLHIHVLIWRASLVVAASRRLFPQRARFWLDPRIRLVLDSTHPLGASHHQKLVIVDDVLAFCSGSDVLPNRWDTQQHAAHDPRRSLDGESFPPRHGVTMAMDGAAAAALAELARARWRQATGEPGAPVPADPVAVWPDQLPVHLRHVEVGIARTQPAYDGAGEVRESEHLYLSAIAAARHLIVMENQYFSCAVIAAALEKRLAEPDGPEIVIVIPAHSPSAVGRLLMDSGRKALVARLRDRDPYRRLSVFAPYAAAGIPVIVHSKVMLVDDAFLRIGSSNLNNRSMRFDTECDVALTAPPGDAGEDVRRVIARFRDDLVAHYLGCTADAVAAAVHRHGGLGAAVRQLDRSKRLRDIPDSRPGPVERAMARFHLGDPVGTADNWKPWTRALVAQLDRVAGSS